VYANGDSCAIILPLSLGLSGVTTSSGVAALSVFISVSMRDGCITRSRLTTGAAGSRVACSYDVTQDGVWMLHTRRAASGTGGPLCASPAPSPSPSVSWSPLSKTGSPYLGAAASAAAAPLTSSSTTRSNGIAHIVLVPCASRQKPWWLRQAMWAGQSDAKSPGSSPGHGKPCAGPRGAALAYVGSLVPPRRFCMVCGHLGVASDRHCTSRPAIQAASGSTTATSHTSFVASIFAFGGRAPVGPVASAAPALVPQVCALPFSCGAASCCLLAFPVVVPTPPGLSASVSLCTSFCGLML
jgi:hypothetical protein